MIISHVNIIEECVVTYNSNTPTKGSSIVQNSRVNNSSEVHYIEVNCTSSVSTVVNTGNVIKNHTIYSINMNSTTLSLTTFCFFTRLVISLSTVIDKSTIFHIYSCKECFIIKKTLFNSHVNTTTITIESRIVFY